MSGPSREFLDRQSQAFRTGRTIVIEGVQWRVYELDYDHYDRRTSPSLVFESDTAVRRVRDFPVDWRTLTDALLFELSWRR